MTAHDFDSIVIGAGQAGPALAARLAAAGERVAVIERAHMGGTCVNNGCMPTKTMVASAYAAWLARESERFGVGTGPVTVDMQAVRARKDQVVQDARGNVTRWMETTPGITLMQGHARFTGSNTVEVDGTALTAARIFINTGARASVPPIPGIEAVPVLTNADVMDLAEVPKHLLIIGGSYIGLEFAQVFRRLGAQVTVLEQAATLLPREDADVSAGIADILMGEGVQLVPGAREVSLDQDGATTRARFLDGAGQPRLVSVDRVLVATGRRPNTDDLGLETAGVETDARGFIVVDDSCRTSAPHIWALGEVNGRGAFTHTAYNDYEIVAANLLDGGTRRITDRRTCYALFIDPPLGRIGLTETEARAGGRPVLVGKRPMSRVGRAVESGETRGFIKVVVDAEARTLLGAAVLGYRGDEAVQALLSPLYLGTPVDAIGPMIGIHPTVAELLPFAIADAR
jgi:pyruvate/2-oxoglutarate dehydrogenase complex dihydrolipoamide dehydrogenase (E3) component